MSKNYSKKIDWKKVESIPESEYDYDEAPEMNEDFFKEAFVRSPTTKKMISLRLDEDLIEFFKQIDKKYQTKINQVLRAYKSAYERAVRHT